jgi:hypothetical protein
MTGQPLFSPRLLVLWIALGVITFALSLWFMLQQDDAATVGPSSYSHSAIGHAGIAEILERLQIPVVRSKSDSLHKISGEGVLVLAEPAMPFPDDGKLKSLLHTGTILLVLPKWIGQPDPEHPGWIVKATPVALESAERALGDAVGAGEVLRRETAPTWTRNEIGPTPRIAGAVQLVKAAALKPVVASEDGILLGELTAAGREIWVLSDPDVIANHGMALGNAEFAVALFQRLRGSGNVVFDESIHDFDPVPKNPLDLAVQKRFVAMVIEALAAILLLLWATVGRFGAAETAPPPLAAGKQSLIRNVAELMDYAGYQPVLVRRYVDATIRNAALQLHVPRGLDGPASLGWLQHVSDARGGTIDAVAVNERAAVLAASRKRDLPALFGVAREIRQWKQELMDGPARGAQDRRGDPGRSAQGSGRSG